MYVHNIWFILVPSQSISRPKKKHCAFRENFTSTKPAWNCRRSLLRLSEALAVRHKSFVDSGRDKRRSQDDESAANGWIVALNVPFFGGAFKNVKMGVFNEVFVPRKLGAVHGSPLDFQALQWMSFWGVPELYHPNKGLTNDGLLKAQDYLFVTF